MVMSVSYGPAEVDGEDAEDEEGSAEWGYRDGSVRGCGKW
jgi:hypothetical protein